MLGRVSVLLSESLILAGQVKPRRLPVWGQQVTYLVVGMIFGDESTHPLHVLQSDCVSVVANSVHSVGAPIPGLQSTLMLGAQTKGPVWLWVS